MDDLFDLVDALNALPRLSPDTIGATIGAELDERESANRYFHFYEAQLHDGFVSKVSFKEPGAGATSMDKILTLEVAGDTAITQENVKGRFGVPELLNAMPRSTSIQMGYASDRFRLSMLFERDDDKLQEITMVEVDDG